MPEWQLPVDRSWLVSRLLETQIEYRKMSGLSYYEREAVMEKAFDACYAVGEWNKTHPTDQITPIPDHGDIS